MTTWACASCGSANIATAKRCRTCGATMSTQASVRGESRRIVTVVFSDVAGSTLLGEELDPESLRHLMIRYFEEMHAVVRRHGGITEKFIGDALMAVFGVPNLHEDDALRAARACVEMRDRLSLLNDDSLDWSLGGKQSRHIFVLALNRAEMDS